MNNQVDNKSLQAPKMLRSQNQLSHSYSPETVFSWEGGLGVCKSFSTSNIDVSLSEVTRTLILEQINESFTTWLNTGMSKNVDEKIIIEPELLVDPQLLDKLSRRIKKIKIQDVIFIKPEKMMYEPFPLTFLCRKCHRYLFSRSLDSLSRDLEKATKKCKAQNCESEWEQIDVLLAHPIGTISELKPFMKGFNTFSCKACSGKEVKLHKVNNVFKNWLFECVGCKDTDTISNCVDSKFQEAVNNIPGKRVINFEQAKMEPISYRANKIYFVKGDSVLILNESNDYQEYLKSAMQNELLSFISNLFGYFNSSTQKEIQKLQEKIKVMEQTMKLDVPQEVLSSLKNAIVSTEEEVNKLKSLEQETDNRDKIRESILNRSSWSKKYDPFRMVIEHQGITFEKGILSKNSLDHKSNTKSVNGKSVSVNLQEPDDFLLHCQNKDIREEILGKYKDKISLLGLDKIYFVRNIETCDYTFGYSRLFDKSINPKNHPIRLNLFDTVDSTSSNSNRSQEGKKTPIYCIKQSNEGFYIQLNESNVRNWLEINGIDLSKTNYEKLGGFLLEDYSQFSYSLDTFKNDKTIERSAYPYVYTLMHTISHYFMKIISEFSGLDIGSFGEHLFVPDLALLVYRKGTTMDLENLSSMWRNNSSPLYGNHILNEMSKIENLRCGSETACNMRGGACPDCIMIPENNCLTRNELLSRSVLIGKSAPKWDNNQTSLIGYYESIRNQKS